MVKAEIRKKYSTLRKKFTLDEVKEKSQQILDNFTANFSVSEGENVHVFLSIAKFKEIETRFFIDFFRAKGAKIFVPKIHEDTLIAVELREESSLVQNSFGILEPVSVENECSDFHLVITPLLYVDAEGNRVGYGKGFYDQFFKTINKDALKIGVGFFLPLESITDISAHDVTLDYLITPDSILSFSGLEKKSKK